MHDEEHCSNSPDGIVYVDSTDEFSRQVSIECQLNLEHENEELKSKEQTSTLPISS